MRPRCY